jgi:anti-sigma-K factor RskA
MDESGLQGAAAASAAATGVARHQRIVTMAAGVALVSAAVLGGVLLKEHRSLLAETEVTTRTRAAFKAALDASESRNKAANASLETCRKNAAAAPADRAGERDLVSMLSEPNAKVVPFATVQAGAYRGMVALHAASHRLVVSASGVKPIPGIDYEVWLVNGKEPARSGGFLKPGPDGVALLAIDRKLLEKLPESVAVSVEPAGGKASPSRLILIGKTGE